MKNILVLGASGMLGSMVIDYLFRKGTFRLTGTARSAILLDKFQRLYPSVKWVLFDYGNQTREQAFEALGRQDWIINAIGITKPLIKDNNPAQVENAVLINSLLPHDLGRYAASISSRVIQIATDCVYSGVQGLYAEDAPHDALDVYGKTKSVGETWHPNVSHLRCSIIGPEPKDFKFLIEWFRRQSDGATVNGFTNHTWNGITTLHFAKICDGIIAEDIQLDHLQHVIPNGTITKARMLRDFAETYHRNDLVINDIEAETVVDRTLATNYPQQNLTLWKGAGYTTIPTVSNMIAELGSYPYSGADA
jgi:dTDP-4-dehydrorhamnose reductase